MKKAYDVVIVGGGVIGCAVAYFLAADAAFRGSILIVERDPSYDTCATTRSWGGIRQQFSVRENVLMSLYGAAFVRAAPDLLAVDGEAPELGFHEQGYLFLTSEAGLPALEANVRLQCSLGAEVAVLTPDELRRRFPWLSIEGLAGGAQGLRNEGWLDPHAWLHAFCKKARALGVSFAHDEIVGIERKGRWVVGVDLKSQGKLACGVLINAAGPQAGHVASLAGAELPVRPRKRMTFVFDCREELAGLPLTIDPSGVAFRPEGRQYLAIVSPPADQDPDSDDLEPEYDLFDRVIWPALAQRVPAFEAIKLAGAWAGHYDYNCFDQNAIIGPHSEIGGLYFCNGFSGHGVQQAPAAGRAVAELITHDRFVTLDLAALSYARIAEGRPLREANIV